MSTRPPREGLVRAVFPGVETRAAQDGGMPTLTGYFSVFNQPTEIRSRREGHFMEQIAPGAFAKTFQENRERMRVLFQHGRDPQVADKPLGAIRALEEDAHGARYEVELLDTSYNRDLLPGLEAGLYGASFSFSVVREDFDPSPQRSASNPDGIPERVVREAKVSEFGPVTFPAYAGATAGVRSLTDLMFDVDAITAATPILLDEERLEQARVFITRSIPAAEPGEAQEAIEAPETSAESREADLESSDAPASSAEPAMAEAHPAPARRVLRPDEGLWGPTSTRRKPAWLL